jgi:threonine dehydratase
MKFAVYLDDTPGSLARLLTHIAALKANVIHIDHHRSEKDLPILVTRVELELETRGRNHLNDIAETLRKEGYRIELR